MINVYVPTIDKATEQVNFGHLLCNTMRKHFGHSVILGGDLNFNLEYLEIAKVILKVDTCYS